ncbi:MAG: YkgB family protein [Actinomycetota bacterium]|nr:YkgB family protein [Actinomycetota bacterium]
MGNSVLRSALATNLVWVGALKFEDYEVENIHPMVSSSPLFSPFLEKLGEQKTARLIGMTEIAMGSLIAAGSFAPRASAIGSLGAVGMFATTLSFLATTPGVWQENSGAPKLSLVGQFLAKDSVYLGASLLMAADSLRAAHRR